jgi:hypothetical protein
MTSQESIAHEPFPCEATDGLSEADQEAINSVLREHNRFSNPVFWAALDDPTRVVRPLYVVSRDGAGQIAGGLIGETQFSWLKIKILAVQQQVVRKYST